MPLLKVPPAQTKNETIQLRVSQEMKFRLARYAEFIHATTSYVVVEALNRIFDKDREFSAWLDQHPLSTSEPQMEANSTMEAIRKA